jgi:hypothetical protein
MRLSEELRVQKTNTENSVSCTTSLCNPVSDRSKEDRYFSLGHGATTKTPSSGPVRIGTKPSEAQKGRMLNHGNALCLKTPQDIKPFHRKENGRTMLATSTKLSTYASLTKILKELGLVSSIGTYCTGVRHPEMTLMCPTIICTT